MATYRPCSTCQGSGFDGCDWYCYACDGRGQEEIAPDESDLEDEDCNDGEGR